MTKEEMIERFYSLYNQMANSNQVAFMKVFGNVHKQMMDWFIVNKPDMASDWLDVLESIKWKQYLSHKEAERIVGDMIPSAPWSMEQWKSAMTKYGYDLEKEPCYNKYALWTVMNMIMSDSGTTISKFVEPDKQFEFVYKLAVDKLTDKDGKFVARDYFGL